jgi:hypothetical protein
LLQLLAGERGGPRVNGLLTRCLQRNGIAILAAPHRAKTSRVPEFFRQRVDRLIQSRRRAIALLDGIADARIWPVATA